MNTTASGSVDSLYKLAKTRLATALETKLAEFPNALIETHGKDLTVNGSRSSTPQSTGLVSATPPESVPGPTTAKETPVEKSTKAINTGTVVVEATFQAAADDLFGILTDEKRIPHWSKAPAQVGNSGLWCHVVAEVGR